MELYIHIPFCAKKCEYCSFVSFPASEIQKEAYIRALLRETDNRLKEFTDPVETVFIGGGTPSLLSPEQLSFLVCGIRKRIAVHPGAEFTIEANPGTLTENFCRTAVDLGINRFSLGMQAYQERLLYLLGRIHSYGDVEHAVELIGKAGIGNISLDLIFGIPGQTEEDWKETLNAAISLHPSHISAYGLIPEEGTKLYSRLENHDYDLPDPDTERKMYDMAIRMLRQKDYFQYEISNFSRKGFECRHNIGYWTQVPYVGLGISAASMQIIKKDISGLMCMRRLNPSSVNDYMDMVYKIDHSVPETEIILPEESRFETMMLALRMNRGISRQQFSELHSVSLESCYGKQLKRMQKAGLMKQIKGTWSLTRKGMDIQNSVLVELMDDM